MGFNNGYESGYSDCEADNRKKWEDAAYARGFADGGSGGGGSSATPRNPVVMLKDCPVIASEYYGGLAPLFTIDASNLAVGEAIFVDGYGSEAIIPAEVDSFTPTFKILVPAETTDAYDTVGVGTDHVTASSCALQTEGDVKSFNVNAGSTMVASVRPGGLIVRTSETAIYFAPTSADTE